MIKGRLEHVQYFFLESHFFIFTKHFSFFKLLLYVFFPGVIVCINVPTKVPQATKDL